MLLLVCHWITEITWNPIENHIQTWENSVNHRNNFKDKLSNNLHFAVSAILDIRLFLYVCSFGISLERFWDKNNLNLETSTIICSDVSNLWFSKKIQQTYLHRIIIVHSFLPGIFLDLITMVRFNHFSLIIITLTNTKPILVSVLHCVTRQPCRVPDIWCLTPSLSPVIITILCWVKFCQGQPKCEGC